MRMTVAEAASIMGVSKDYIRVGLQRGLLPFGTAVKMSGRYTYYISTNRFFEYIGITDFDKTTSFYNERSESL
jgi:excisionase family DNA binding protein